MGLARPDPMARSGRTVLRASCSLQRLAARAANTIARPASIESRTWVVDRPGSSVVLGHGTISRPEEPVAGIDYDPAVRGVPPEAFGEIGDVTVQAASALALASSVRSTRRVRPVI
jgi:hypothetical protein